MSLGEHLAEFRNRLVKSVIAIVIGMVAGWILYGRLLNLLSRPLNTTIRHLAEARHLTVIPTFTGVADPFLFQIKISLVFGLVLASPIWLYQLWAFIAPGLHKQEKKWAYVFSGAAAPVFAIGIVVAYLTLPRGLQILINFTPNVDNIQNLIELPKYLNFLLRTMLAFGVGFEIPLIVLFLAILGVVGPKVLSKARPYIIVGIWVFGAVATPSGDPVTLSMVSAPMTILYLIAEVVAQIVAKRKYKRDVAAGLIDPDETDEDDELKAEAKAEAESEKSATT